MKIAIVNAVAGKSSKELANFLRDPPHQVDVFKPYKLDKYNYLEYDLVFNYGCGGGIRANKIINTNDAVAKCVDKTLTFEAFKRAKVDTVEYVRHREDIPKKWEWVVVRDSAVGRKAEGLNYLENKPNTVFPYAALYTEYFYHKKEYRVVIFMGKLVGVYEKEEADGEWSFILKPKRGFEEMVSQCIRAAKEIGIDYVGFDVVANTKNDFKLLEANSAPILTAESMAAIHQHIYQTE
jgi:hypothetical protein